MHALYIMLYNIMYTRGHLLKLDADMLIVYYESMVLMFAPKNVYIRKEGESVYQFAKRSLADDGYSQDLSEYVEKLKDAIAQRLLLS
jgi:hypothetical protein